MLRCILIFTLIIALFACKSDKNKINSERQEALDQAVKVAPQNGISVPHYMCPSGCVGGFADGAGPCPKCGVELMHNQAYHANSSGNVNRSSQSTQQVQQSAPSQVTKQTNSPNNFPQPQNLTPAKPDKVVIQDPSRVIKMPEDKSGGLKIKK